MTRTWRTREELVLQVVLLARQGTPRRAIARGLGVSRNTVKALLAQHGAQRATAPLALPPPKTRAPRPQKVDRWRPRIAALLTTYHDITAQRVFEILREEGFDGGYTGVKRGVRALRPPPPPRVSQETPTYGPGGMAENDWSPYEINFTDGGKTTVQACSYVLVHSRRKAYALYDSADLHALMDGHVQAFRRLGGCAARCKYDSQKPVVLRWEGDQPIYNPRFLAFSAHYEFRPVAVRRGHPNDKPRVERSFWELERSFLNGRTFRDLDDMRAQLVDWLDRIVDHRPQRDKRTALERFADEAPHLAPLPRGPYDTARVIYRLCSIDGYVAWAGNQYAVPYDHVTDFLAVRITQRELFVYGADLRCVARHELAPRGAGKRLDPGGLHPRPQRRAPMDLEQVAAVFRATGEHGAEFFRRMSLGRPRIWGSHARQILLLRERYGTDALDHALGHATEYGAFEFAAIERILAARALPRTLDEYVAEETARRLDDTLGHARTRPRDLTEYDRLPLASSTRPGRLVLPSPQETDPWHAPHDPNAPPSPPSPTAPVAAPPAEPVPVAVAAASPTTSCASDSCATSTPSV